MRRFLWQDVLKNTKVFNTDWVYLHAILSVVAIFAVCAFVDVLRIRFIEKPFFSFWDKKWGKFAEKYASFEESLLAKFKIGKESEKE